MKKGLEYNKEWSAFINSDDEDAFHDLYAHYFKYLYFIGLKKGFSSDRVKDNINDLFLYLWEKRNGLSNVTNHHNYIITSFLRKLYRKDNIEIDDSVMFSDLVELQLSPSVESLYITQNAIDDLSRVVKAFVEKLPGKQKQMVYQKFFLGLSYKEIAEANNISVNTVYNTIYKAVEKLKNQMERDKIAALRVLFLLLFCCLCLIFFRKFL